MAIFGNAMGRKKEKEKKRKPKMKPLPSPPLLLLAFLFLCMRVGVTEDPWKGGGNVSPVHAPRISGIHFWSPHRGLVEPHLVSPFPLPKG